MIEMQGRHSLRGGFSSRTDKDTVMRSLIMNRRAIFAYRNTHGMQNHANPRALNGPGGTIPGRNLAHPGKCFITKNKREHPSEALTASRAQYLCK